MFHHYKGLWSFEAFCVPPFESFLVGLSSLQVRAGGSDLWAPARVTGSDEAAQYSHNRVGTIRCHRGGRVGQSVAFSK